MWIIKRAQIRNFRSIIDGEFAPSNFSIIVGPNDVGKSNYLRALNLFFNDETDVGVAFNFSTDFSLNAIKGKGKAKQIEITLDLQPPPSFADSSLIRWKKIWREESPSFYWEGIYRLPGRAEIAGKSKVRQWMKRIRFRYVPAIKGTEYFTSLLRALHDTLAETVDLELRQASADLIAVVRGHTGAITEYISTSLSLQSELQLPQNLRPLFEVLDFSTTSGSNNLSLRLRGDGVKVRHIPAILRFLAEQDYNLAAPGKPKPTTIWGYEEPENNLEMRKAFEHAQELLTASVIAQIIVTTHSPALYGLALDDKTGEVTAFNAALDSTRGTQIVPVASKAIKELDVGMGYMPLIAPYLVDKIKELDLLHQSLETFKQQATAASKPWILVAGQTDVTYVLAAIDEFSPKLSSKIDVSCIGTNDAAGSKGAGDDRLNSLLTHFDHCPELLTRKAIFLFDCDAKPRVKSKNPNIKVVQLQLDSKNKKAKKGIENLLPDYAFQDDFYVEREKELDYGGSSKTKTLDKVLLSKAVCGGHRALDLFDDRAGRLAGFKEFVAEIEAFVRKA
jgi:energy-coupling factor transporter ATP-binding protein EcfA2